MNTSATITSANSSIHPAYHPPSQRTTGMKALLVLLALAGCISFALQHGASEIADAFARAMRS